MKNFKSWKDSGEVKLAPLTGFFGTNSSGKSSLLQMLLLLKQTVGTDEVIFFGDENSLVNLGSFREAIHGYNIEVVLELEFGCKPQNSLKIMTFQPIGRYHSDYCPLNIDSFTFHTAISENAEGLSIEHFSYTIGPEESEKIEWKNGKLYHEHKQKGDITVTGCSVTKCYGSPISERVDLLLPLSSAFENLFNHVYPLGPTCVQPKRSYHWEGTNPDSVGQRGEYMIDSMLNARVDQQTTPYKGQKVPIEERITWWLREMDLAYSFSIKRKSTGTDRNHDVLIQRGPNSAKITLADMGYGLSQFLPVLVHCYYAPEGSTLILEQPGVHLHPMAQAQLADLFLEVITERNLQILVESHSEHLLTRLQRRVAEKQIGQDDVGLYFCRNKDGVSTIERLEVTESGDIKNWPENFFGDVMGDMFAMTDKQVERMTDQDPEG